MFKPYLFTYAGFSFALTLTRLRHLLAAAGLPGGAHIISLISIAKSSTR